MFCSTRTTKVADGKAMWQQQNDVGQVSTK